MTLMFEEKTLEGGGAAPEAAMPQIEKERSLAEPNRLPAGPRKKRPLGRLFSSIYIQHSAVRPNCDVKTSLAGHTAI